MNRIRLSLKFLNLLVISLLLNGCGYHLVGTGSSLPPHLKTLSIPVFSNSSSEPEIHRELTSNIIDSFISDGRLKVVRKGESDMVMKGTLYYYDLKAVSFSSSDFVSDYIVELGVDVEVIDKVNDIVSSITAAVEEQSVTTKEIAANVGQTAQGIRDISDNVVSTSNVSKSIAKDISGVNQATQAMSNMSSQMNVSAGELTNLAEQLNKMFGRFKV